MNLDKFHDIFRDYMLKKSEDVKLIVALDSTLEKWFQGEMALAFSEQGTGHKIFSSQRYDNYFENEPGDENDDGWNEGEWEALIENSGIITIEGSVFKKVKSGKTETTGARAIDFLLEKRDEYVFSEIKVLWFDNIPDKNTLDSDLERTKVLEDAWRLKKNLLGEYRNGSKALFLYLTLICIGDIGPERNMRENVASILSKYLGENNSVSADLVRVDRISKNDTHHLSRIAGDDESGDFDHLNDIFLMTVDLTA